MDLLAALGLACPEAGARSGLRERHSAHADGPASVSDPCARAVLDALGHDPVSLDLVVVRTGMSGAQVQAAVSALELDGHIECLVGGQLSRIVS
jgi:predicted Rossmann fold nucleotide-binding protein DprA/Smf involved in DNA uptake